MEHRLKQLVKELGDAINLSLADSDQIAEVISRIKQQGYDVFLVLEATVGVNRREEAPEENIPSIGPGKEAELQVNAQDVRFLKSLRISLDDAA